MDFSTLLKNIREVSNQFAAGRKQRQHSRTLAKSDFETLAEAGFLLVGVPVEMGGLWQSVGQSLANICDCLRILGQGDSSVALVASMHPAVLSSWLGTVSVPDQFAKQWCKQREEIFNTALNGAWWGTITSEPGSGGDINKTKAIANKIDDSLINYELTGQKHFGSGLGITSYMITTAIPEGEAEPDLFYLDVRDFSTKPDKVSKAKLIAEWDGHGMTATQSHAVAFEKYPASRVALPNDLNKLKEPVKMVNPCLFTSVIVGIVETAFNEARSSLKRRPSLSSYEKVEWTKAIMQEWLIKQAYNGMIAEITDQNNDALIAKTTIAELAESALTRLCRIMGGGTFSRQSPFGFWAEDVRALGFLRPPWSLAFDNIFDAN